MKIYRKVAINDLPLPGKEQGLSFFSGRSRELPYKNRKQ